jgi:hypothetical protein
MLTSTHFQERISLIETLRILGDLYPFLEMTLLLMLMERKITSLLKKCFNLKCSREGMK